MGRLFTLAVLLSAGYLAIEHIPAAREGWDNGRAWAETRWRDWRDARHAADIAGEDTSSHSEGQDDALATLRAQIEELRAELQRSRADQEVMKADAPRDGDAMASQHSGEASTGAAERSATAVAEQPVVADPQRSPEVNPDPISRQTDLAARDARPARDQDERAMQARREALMALAERMENRVLGLEL